MKLNFELRSGEVASGGGVTVGSLDPLVSNDEGAACYRITLARGLKAD